jgi:hypothetical protein
MKLEFELDLAGRNYYTQDGHRLICSKGIAQLFNVEPFKMILTASDKPRKVKGERKIKLLSSPFTITKVILGNQPEILWSRARYLLESHFPKADAIYLSIRH